MKQVFILITFLIVSGVNVFAQNMNFDPKLAGNYKDTDPRAGSSSVEITVSKEGITAPGAQINILEAQKPLGAMNPDGSMYTALWTLGRAKNLKVKITINRDKAGNGETMVVTDELTKQTIGTYKKSATVSSGAKK